MVAHVNVGADEFDDGFERLEGTDENGTVGLEKIEMLACCGITVKVDGTKTG